jgi:hypothetical protein
VSQSKKKGPARRDGSFLLARDCFAKDFSGKFHNSPFLDKAIFYFPLLTIRFGYVMMKKTNVHLKKLSARIDAGPRKNFGCKIEG